MKVARIVVAKDGRSVLLCGKQIELISKCWILFS